ncbi:hypothetical protein [uncultured Halopseudomonas sp.]|uniref:hypothetical protein n=1 Tax=uncultured Halopseudomonas sp. TaxID=2901193 RepID=UPI0030EEE091|tara:strand:+ start:14834 stop:15259 length:426 start_codon:yes stop_codon:yes gene_type:complete
MSNDHEGSTAEHQPVTMRLDLKLSEKARPLFEQAAQFAHAKGLWVSMSSSINENAVAELILSARFPSDEAPSIYRLIGDEARQKVIHEMEFGRDQTKESQETQPTALNDMVIDTQLEHFFSKAFDLHLDYLTEKQHPPGFW